MKKTTRRYLNNLQKYSNEHFRRAISIAKTDIFGAIRELYKALVCDKKYYELYYRVEYGIKKEIDISYGEVQNKVCLNNAPDDERINNIYLHYNLLWS